MLKKKALICGLLAVLLIAGSCLPAFADDLNYPYQPGIYHYTDSSRYSVSNIQYLSDSSVVVNGKTYSARQFRFTFSDLSIWTGDEICVVLPYTFKSGEIDTAVKSSIRVSFAVAGWSWEIMDSVFLSPWDFATSNSVYRRLSNGNWTNGAASSIFSVDRVENCYRNNTGITFYSDDLYATGDMIFILMLRRKANSPATDLTIYDYDFQFSQKSLLEQEESKANSGGNAAADDVGSAIPSDTGGATSGIKGFVSAMAYGGTDAKWKFPALYLPAIPGIMERVDLTPEQDIDFGMWVQGMPSNIVEVVQIVCTIALVLYCFKELYGMISYFLTLKGGGNDE